MILLYIFFVLWPFLTPFGKQKIHKIYSNIFGALSEYSNIFECLKCNKSEYEYIFEAQNIRIFEYSCSSLYKGPTWIPRMLPATPTYYNDFGNYLVPFDIKDNDELFHLEIMLDLRFILTCHIFSRDRR